MLPAHSLTDDARGPQQQQPIVIAHRGASGYRPEHTLAAYQLAIEMGADFIEPDLVMTQDGVLVARHENEISSTTDVAERPEFASRRVTKTIDGASIPGWFTEDFTLAELKTLHVQERIPDLRPQNVPFNGQFEIPTLQEIIDLVRHLEGDGRAGRIGLYPETKHPTYFDSIGLSMEEPFVRLLHDNGYRDQHAPVFIQSFEVANLLRLSRLTRLPLVQLINSGGKPYDWVVSGDPRTYARMTTPAGLSEIAQYAAAIGPNKNWIVPRDTQNRLLPPTSLVRDAHAQGLLVHPWAFRNENTFLPADYQVGNPASPTFARQHGDATAEYRLFFDLGVHGLFSDYPDTAVSARTGRPSNPPSP
jgi:glycerophosphoryl diester phosphodiesterase